MPWCHQCRQEFVEGTEACPDCGGSLSPQPPTCDDPDHNSRVYEYADSALLTTLGDSTQISLVEGLLKERGIPVYFRYIGPAGQYMKITGHIHHSGAEALVPAERLEEAREVIAGFEFQSDAPDRATESAMPQGSRNVRRVLAWILLIVFGLGIVPQAIVYIVHFLRMLGRMLAG